VFLPTAFVPAFPFLVTVLSDRMTSGGGVFLFESPTTDLESSSLLDWLLGSLLTCSVLRRMDLGGGCGRIFGAGDRCDKTLGAVVTSSCWDGGVDDTNSCEEKSLVLSDLLMAGRVPYCCVWIPCEMLLGIVLSPLDMVVVVVVGNCSCCPVGGWEGWVTCWSAAALGWEGGECLYKSGVEEKILPSSRFPGAVESSRSCSTGALFRFSLTLSPRWTAYILPASWE